ncbi:hypothetical protein ACOTHJ_14825 [Achromobacter xylosoxidans]|uniref:hypothetical protein n=1 Tax=Achromobacter anxifer TaxID=1287737 RepID=UPI00155CE048|nr:hypothetical protein [Achromobacter anxifer]CAB5514265.1 hypothetical protein LMG26857_03323 [Achromobacter anxifer]
MSDVLKAREAAIQAETAAEQTCNLGLDQLHKMNARLVDLHDEIRAAQPVANNSVCLELYACGPGCAGCPHPRWIQYRWTDPPEGKKAMLLGMNLGAKGKDPILALSRKEKHYAATAGLIREAKTILIKRAKLLAVFKSLRYAAQSKLP